jgi:hypothetical protein
LIQPPNLLPLLSPPLALWLLHSDWYLIILENNNNIRITIDF